MARTIAECKCEVCGVLFKKVAFKRNRTEAHSFQEWAEENCKECPECYAKRVAKERAQKVEAMGLPEIKAVSEKQLKYASDLRTKYAAENEDLIKIFRRLMKAAATQEAREAAEKQGITVEEAVAANIKYYKLEKAQVCVTEAEAHKIIEALIDN